MSIGLSIAVYFVCWWTVLFVVLPLGVKTQGEAGEVVPGTPESAPVTLPVIRIIGLTTLISAIVFALIFCAVTYRWIALDDIPFLPHYEKNF